MEQEVTAFLKACVSGLTARSGGMMEVEAADPQNVDMEGMEDGEDGAYMEKTQTMERAAGARASQATAMSLFPNEGTEMSVYENRTYQARNDHRHLA